MSEKYVVIHGHFYQPPRESPWLGRIDRQDSAYPYHDWNERINRECYHPNGFSRILDHYGRVKDMVLNYKYINFNIGPTLFDWIEKHDKTLYEKIIQADKESIKMFGGHGNAIAQVYNHVIMPLANERDRVTQIEWGIAHFRRHFRRYPEAMWLAETAINDDTIKDLIKYGMKYVILSPTQVEKCRFLNDEGWHDVSHANIDTRMPYRIFHPEDRNKYIDAFFYNKDISTGISFLHYLRDAHRLADEFHKQTYGGDAPELVIACTDGESYGHHEHFGDMCLGYFLEKVCKERDLIVTNLGQYLDEFPPVGEAVLKTGPEGEGTAWSCSHGVGRWIRDCGCKAGGDENWHQYWRGPLRSAFDYLRDTIGCLFEEKLKNYFEDVWDARNKYIRVILDYSDSKRESFLRKNCLKKNLSSKEKNMIFAFLESQKNLLLMYTSCGWFFSEVSGIEPVQNMKYALMAMQCISPYTSISIMQTFLKKMEKAKGNLKYPSNAREVFDLHVRRCVVDSHQIAANVVVALFLENSIEDMDIYYYKAKVKDQKKAVLCGEEVIYGALILKDNVLGCEYDFKYYLFGEDIKKLHCYIVDKKDAKEKELFAFTDVKDVHRLLSKLSKGKFYGLMDLFMDNTEELISIALKDDLNILGQNVVSLYEKHKELIALFAISDVPIPKVMKDLCSYYVMQKIKEKLDSKNDEDIEHLESGFLLAKKIHINLNEEKIQQRMIDAIFSELEVLEEFPKIAGCEKVIKLLRLKEEVGIDIASYLLEEKVFALLKKKEWKANKRFYKKLKEMAGYFNIAV